MNIKRVALGGAGALAVLAAALGSTYLMVNRCNDRSQGTSLDIANAHRWVHQLNLTEGQKARLSSLEASLQRDLGPLQRRLAEERTALCALLGKDVGDETQLDAYADRVAILEAQQQRRIVHHLWEMRSILTPPQRETFSTALMQAICESCRGSTGTACVCQGHEKHETK